MESMAQQGSRLGVFAVAVTLWLNSSCVANGSGRIAPDLLETIKAADTGAMIAVIVNVRSPTPTTDPQTSLPSTSLSTAELRAVARRAQTALLDLLETKRRLGNASDIRSLWIDNTIAVKATPGVIRELANRDDVIEIVSDREIPGPPFSSGTADQQEPSR